jgi:hypothetical protein
MFPSNTVNDHRLLKHGMIIHVLDESDGHIKLAGEIDGFPYRSALLEKGEGRDALPDMVRIIINGCANDVKLSELGIGPDRHAVRCVEMVT